MSPASIKPIQRRARSASSTDARTNALASRTALGTLTIRADEILGPRGIRRQVDLPRNLAKTVDYGFLARCPGRSFGQDFEGLGVNRPTALTCASSQPSVNVRRHISDVQSRHSWRC